MPPTAKPDVAVVGAGYIGAVLSAVLADRGAFVRAVDIDDRVIRAYNAGTSPVQEPGLDELIGEVVRAGRPRIGSTGDRGSHWSLW